MHETPTSRSVIDLAFERKVRLSTWALAFERLWPRIWAVLGLLGLFLLVSLLGLWGQLPAPAHKLLLAAFVLAFLGALVWATRISWPAREDAIRRIEGNSGVPHRPATSYEDTLTAGASDPATQAIWQAHRERLARLIARLKVGQPSPRTERFDPIALRALLLLVVTALAGLVGDSFSDRIGAAFRFHTLQKMPDGRLDAWVSPPPYTAKAPIMLADGARPGAPMPGGDGKLFEVPERSVLVVRAAGLGVARLSLEILGEGGEPQTISSEPPAKDGEVVEVKHEIRSSARVRALAAGSEMAVWTFSVIPDTAPKIALTKDPERTPRGSMKLFYKVEDDYGVASALARFKKAPAPAADPAKSWARPEQMKGPRPPQIRPPVVALRIPGANPKQAEGQTHLELAAHPWAGMRVTMRLEARDQAGQIGRSEPRQIVLPSRHFTKPLARAVIEQRRKLFEDPRQRLQVVRALDALTLEPQGFIDRAGIYLGLRSVAHRLARDRSRAALRASTDQLWHIALKIEDGDLSDAERALREAQDKLAKALEEGASDAEVQKLMQELRQAMNQYLEQMQKQAQPMDQPMDGQDQQQQMLSQQDLERMMRDIENMAKNGSRDQAQQMLSELRDLLDRLQANKMSEGQGQKSQQMNKMMDQLGNVIGQQQRLMDDTFGEQRQQGQKGQQGQRGQQRPGQQQGNQGPRGQKGQQGQQGQQQGQRGQGQQQGGQGQDPGGQGPPQAGQGLGQKQAQIRERLRDLQRELEQFATGGQDKLDGAREAMENAEQALGRGDLDEALQQQAEALDQMRQGAQSMAQEMGKQMPSRYGKSGDAPRDPLGRPQRSEGPDHGTSVKVPDQIDIQRAREILEELRRRSGEATRPPSELDYIDRLLKRF